MGRSITREDRLFGGSALALQVSAGDFADRIHSLLKVNGQGEKIDSVAGTGGSGRAAEDRGVAVADKAGAVCKSCELAGLDYERTAREIGFERSVILKHFLSSFSEFLRSARMI